MRGVRQTMKPETARKLLWYGAAALGAMLPFLVGLGGGFLPEWDDGGFLLDHEHLSWSFRDLFWQFTHNLQTVYTPVATLSLTVDRTALGMIPWLCRLHQLVLYGAAAALLYGIAREFRIRPRLALGLTLLWAWNPARAETVCWIAERKGVLSALFAFGAFWLFQRGLRRGRWAAGAAGLMFPAIWSKPWVLPLPGVMTVYAFCRRPRAWRRNLKTLLLPVLAGGLAALISVGMTFRELAGNGVFRPAVAAGNFFRYLAAALWPGQLNPVHPRFDWSAVWPEVAAGILLALILVAVAWKLRVRRLTVIGFALVYGGLYLPLATGGGFTNTDYADRYGFLLAAVFWLFAGVLAETYMRRRLRENGIPRVWLIAATALAAGYWVGIARYAPLFGDSAALFRAAVSVPQPNLKAMEGLGLTGWNRQDPALLELAAAKMLDSSRPSDPACRNTGLIFAGLAAGLRHDSETALNFLLPLLESGRGGALYNGETFLPASCSVAVEALLRLRERDRACRLLEIQLRRRWGNPAELYFASGLLGRLTGDDARAFREWSEALKLRPDDERIRYNLQVLRSQRPAD